jgi:hypothetical protein
MSGERGESSSSSGKPLGTCCVGLYPAARNSSSKVCR